VTTLQRTLHIAAAIDETYLAPLQVAVTSLQKHLRPSLTPRLYLLNRNLNRSGVESIAKLIDTCPIVPGEGAVRKLPRQSGFPPEASFPLLLAEFLPPDVERVLFLDPDLLIFEDVGEIWDTDAGDNIIAAVRDMAIPTCWSPRGVKNSRELGIPLDAPYFNAGVMLIDMTRWREDQVASRVGDYLNRYAGRTDFSHQEGLNSVLWNKWKQLDQRWNLIASLTGRRYSRNAADTRSAAIVHFAGRFKPWQFDVGGPFSEHYTEALQELGLHRAHIATTKERVLSAYDRYLRDYLYGIEHSLWAKRLT
jgi:lipopolysaccharide biosynthesis glycosyltransferase